MKAFAKQAIRDEKGQAMILALVLLLVSGLMIAPLLSFMGTGLRTGEVYETRTEELYAADAGVEDAIWRIQTGNITPPKDCSDPEYWSYNISNVNGKFVEYAVRYRKTGGRIWYDIRSTSVSGGSNATAVECKVEIVPGSELNIFSGALASQTSIDLAKGSTVNGDVYYCSGTNISKQDVSGNWTYQGCGLFPMQSENVAFANTFKTLAMPPAGQTYENGRTISQNGVVVGSAYIIGNLDITASNIVLNGTIYVTGTINAENNLLVTGKGSIVAEGPINFKKDLTYNVTGDSIIMSLYGGIDIDKAPGINALLYAPNGLINFRKEATVTGGVVGMEIDASKTGSFTYIAKTSWDLPGGRPAGLRVATYSITP